jgi:CHAD domain-containing protein
MSFKLERNEKLATGLKRVAEEQLTLAIDSLRASENVDEAVYKARKNLKRVRALLRLIRDPLGPIYVEENRRLRDVGRFFSKVRDAAVSVEVVDSLAAEYKSARTINKYTAQLKEKKGRPAGEHVLQALSWLGGAHSRVEDWPLTGITRDELEKALARTHRNARKALRLSQAEPRPENFHELRKLSKRYLFQVNLLRPEDQTLGNAVKALNDLLGDHHNLVVTLESLEKPSQRMIRLIARHMRELETKAVAAAIPLFEPADVASKLQNRPSRKPPGVHRISHLNESSRAFATRAP